MKWFLLFLLTASLAFGLTVDGIDPDVYSGADAAAQSNNLTAAFIAADNVLSNNLTAALSGGGGDVYLASNNVFTGENTFSDVNMDSNNIRGINILQFTNGAAGGSQGELIFNNHHETLRFNMDGTQIDIGQHVMWHVEAGENITKGEVVYAGGSTNNHIKAFKYIANGGTPARYIIGISAEDINTAERGAVTHFGRLDSLSVTNLTVGDILYCSDTVAGGLTNTAPTLEVPIAFAIETNGIAIRVQARDENDFRWTSIDGTGSNNVDKIAINQALYLDGEEITAIQTNLLAADIDDFTNAVETIVQGDGSTKILDMDDATGTNTEWTEWAISGTQDQNDNWRIGVIASNLTIQVRVSGAWTNAASFTRP